MMRKLVVEFLNVDGDYRIVEWESLQAMMKAIDSMDDDIAMTAPSLDYKIVKIDGLLIEREFETFEDLYNWYHDDLEQVAEGYRKMISESFKPTVTLTENCEDVNGRSVTVEVVKGNETIRLVKFFEDGSFDKETANLTRLSQVLGRELALNFVKFTVTKSKQMKHMNSEEMWELKTLFDALGGWTFIEDYPFEQHGGICKSIEHQAQLYFYKNRSYQYVTIDVEHQMDIDIIDAILSVMDELGFRNVSTKDENDSLEDKLSVI